VLGRLHMMRTCEDITVSPNLQKQHKRIRRNAFSAASVSATTLSTFAVALHLCSARREYRTPAQWWASQIGF
jgi:hypothetical protein